MKQQPKYLDAKTLKDLFAGRQKHKCYTQTVAIATSLRRHADGKDYGDLISKKRPSESDEIQKYRSEIMVPFTEGTFSKILTCLMKIRKSPDWSVKFDADKVPASVRKGEEPAVYLEKKFPNFGSLTNWTFQLAMKQYAVDANAICMVCPLEIVIDKSNYLRPYPIIFPSENVYAYESGEYAVLLSTDKYIYDANSGAEGKVIYFVNNEVIQRYEQRSADQEAMTMAWEYKHGLDVMPAFKLRGLVYQQLDKAVIYKSRLNPIVAYLDEAVREYSDLQAEVTQHIHSTFWYREGPKCPACQGRGVTASITGPKPCEKCKGEGSPPTSPFTHIKVRTPQIGEQIAQGEPAGYIQKQVEIVKIQDERVQKHLFNALAAINMEFLSQVPLNQSGEAKKTDRDELTTFVNSIAEDLVGIMDQIAFISGEMRYKAVVADATVREKMLPRINVPDRFDIFSSDYLLQELQTARTGKVNPIVLTALETEYAGKKFSTDDSVHNFVQAVLQLDPLSGKTEDEKIVMLQNKGIREIDYVISCNIYPFLLKANENDEAFFGKKLEEKRKVLETFAQEIIDANSAKGKVMPFVDPNNPPVPPPGPNPPPAGPTPPQPPPPPAK